MGGKIILRGHYLMEEDYPQHLFLPNDRELHSRMGRQMNAYFFNKLFSNTSLHTVDEFRYTMLIILLG